MDKYNKIYVFFIVLAMLAWNPLSYYLFYSGTGIESSKILLASITFIFLMEVWMIFRIRSNKASERFKNISLLISFTGILFCLAVLGDRLVGKVYRLEEQNGGLVGVPNTSARYTTVEFDFTTKTNSLGLRDSEVNLKKDKYRILCFGDSWTLGFGVNSEDSWPRKLEKFLQAKGMNVEVLNCGQVGMYPTGYSELIRKVLPVLKPDMVLVGVLQFEDLAQEYEFNFPLPEKMTAPDPLSRRIPFAISQFIGISFENILFVRQQKQNEVLNIDQLWAADVKKMLQEGGRFEKLRFSYYDDSIQHLMETGNFNAVLVSYYLGFPERKFIFNNPHNRATVFASNQLLKDFRDMKATCDSMQSKLVFVNLPFPDFTGHEVFRIPEMDQFDTHFTQNNHIDSIYRSVAGQVEIPYIELTQKFRALEDKKAYFYRYDNHPNIKGYEEIAKTVSDSLLQYINR